MRPHDTVSSITLLILSIFVCLESTRLHIGSLSSPGSGFFPLVLGIAIGILSLLILIKTYLKKQETNRKQKLCAKDRGQKKVLYILLGLVAYGVLLEWLGYTITTFLLFLFLLRAWSPKKWYVVIGSAFLIAAVSYVIFQLGLSAQLPRGFLGF